MIWQDLLHEDHLKSAQAQSGDPSLLGTAIFKHSTRCGVSRMVKSQLEREWDFSPEELPIYYLDLIRYRNLSNQIAQELGVWHESPQIIVLRNGEVVHHASHYSIAADQVRKALEQVRNT